MKLPPWAGSLSLLSPRHALPSPQQLLPQAPALSPNLLLASCMLGSTSLRHLALGGEWHWLAPKPPCHRARRLPSGRKVLSLKLQRRVMSVLQKPLFVSTAAAGSTAPGLVMGRHSFPSQYCQQPHSLKEPVLSIFWMPLLCQVPVPTLLGLTS